MNDRTALMPIGDAVRAATGRRFHRNTIATWRRNGSLHCVCVGKRWHTTISDVKKMIENQTATARTEASK